MAILTINKNFDKEVLQADRPVLVDFWAPWCGYCRRLAPAFDRVAEAYGDRLLFAKLNVDDEMQVAEAYQVDTIPTLLLFKDGKLQNSVVNPGSQAAIEDWLAANGI